MARLGIITGLASEAACLEAIPAAERPPLRCAGANAIRAREASRSLLDDGCTALMSFGLAGGLVPRYAPGTLIVADAVVGADGRRYETDGEWCTRLWAALKEDMNAKLATLAGSDQALRSSAAKEALGRSTGAAAVDMESHGVAEVALERSVPFVAVRAVADPFDRRIPGWIAGSVAADGEVRYLAVILGLMLRPWELPNLIALAGDSERALAALRGAVARAGPRFGLA
ncbi:MAG: hypothetical protein EXQ86_04250 [Rhodospirillales bacterium]|nr:hypothetical protein [Rhodospirillales bacterium]